MGGTCDTGDRYEDKEKKEEKEIGGE